MRVRFTGQTEAPFVMVPESIILAVCNGDVDVVRTWLDDGGSASAEVQYPGDSDSDSDASFDSQDEDRGGRFFPSRARA